MNTGNNTAGKTAPERYVSEKAFEELPDAFQKLAELLGEDQFELVAVNEKERPTPIPGLLIQTEAEKGRHEAAVLRREMRKERRNAGF